MGLRTDNFDLGRLMLGSGEARRLELEVEIHPFEFGGERYVVGRSAVVLDVSRTVGGYSLRLRSSPRLHGPCMRCLEEAGQTVAVDAREVDQPGGGEELTSPYLSGEELDLEAWARDALALALPVQIVCREDCLGLCPVCGVDLNATGPGHAHEPATDPRWAKLGELRFE